MVSRRRGAMLRSFVQPRKRPLALGDDLERACDEARVVRARVTQAAAQRADDLY